MSTDEGRVAGDVYHWEDMRQMSLGTRLPSSSAAVTKEKEFEDRKLPECQIKMGSAPYESKRRP